MLSTIQGGHWQNYSVMRTRSILVINVVDFGLRTFLEDDSDLQPLATIMSFCLTACHSVRAVTHRTSQKSVMVIEDFRNTALFELQHKGLRNFVRTTTMRIIFCIFQHLG